MRSQIFEEILLNELRKNKNKREKIF